MAEDEGERLAVYAKHWQALDLEAWAAAPPGALSLTVFLSTPGETKTLWTQRLDVVWFQLEADCGFVGGLHTDRMEDSRTFFSLGPLAHWRRPSFKCCVTQIFDAATKKPLTNPAAWVAPGTCLVYITAAVHALPTRQIEWRPPPYYWVHLPRAAHHLVKASSTADPSWSKAAGEDDTGQSIGLENTTRWLSTRMSYALCAEHPAHPRSDCEWCAWHPRIGSEEAGRSLEETIKVAAGGLIRTRVEDLYNVSVPRNDPRRKATRDVLEPGASCPPRLPRSLQKK